MEAAAEEPAPAVIVSKTKFKLEPLRKKANARPPKSAVANKRKAPKRDPRFVRSVRHFRLLIIFVQPR